MRKIVFILFIAIAFQACKKEPFTLLWNKVPTDTPHNLYSITVTNDTLIVFGGATFEEGVQSKIYMPTNEIVATNIIAPKAIYASSFINTEKGAACGYDGKIYITDDNGNNWNLLQTTSWRALQDIEYKYNWGVAAGGLGNKGSIQVNYLPDWQWNEILFDRELKAVAITDSSTAFVVGNGIVLKTIDQGISWNAIEIAGDMFTDIQFVNDKVGYILGYSGLLFKTTNGGKNWQQIKIQKGRIINRGYFNTLHFYTENDGFIAGNDGVILKTTDGGKNWQQGDYPHNTNFYDIWYSGTTNTGYACGSNGTLIQFSY